MALSADQKAVLELLLAGQGYPELQELLGIGEDALRQRAHDALAELGGEDPDRNVALTDYLLGQADPIGRADAVRHLRRDRADHELATRIQAELRTMVPAAELPTLPPPPGGGFGSRTADRDAESERPSPLARLPQGRSRLLAGLGAAALVLIVAILAVAGAFSGDGESSDSDAPDASASNGANGQGGGFAEIPDGEELSRVPLTAPGGGDARGAAIVGLSTGDQPYLDLLIENLEPASQGDAYVIWFMFDRQTGYPLSPIFPDEQGSFNDRFAIPTAVVSLIPNARRIEVSVSDARQTLRQIQRAAERETFQIERPGRAVLSGTIPAADRGQGEANGGSESGG